jgi:hypothetical protein
LCPIKFLFCTFLFPTALAGRREGPGEVRLLARTYFHTMAPSPVPAGSALPLPLAPSTSPEGESAPQLSFDARNQPCTKPESTSENGVEDNEHRLHALAHELCHLRYLREHVHTHTQTSTCVTCMCVYIHNNECVHTQIHGTLVAAPFFVAVCVCV